MKLKAFVNRVLVQPATANEKASGVIVPDNVRRATEKHLKGKVVSVGGRIDTELNPIPLEEGQFVYFNPFGNTEIEFGDQKYFVLREEDILAVEE